jgi:hypothetical protein
VRPRLAVALGILLAAACAGGERAAPPAAAAAKDTTPDPFAILAAEEPQPALFECLVGDSAVYGDVRVDPETGDTVGVTLGFWRSGLSVYGTTIITSGGRTDTVPFARVQLSGPDSVAFDTPHPFELDTIRFIGRVDCNRVWGRQRNRRESPSRPAVYRRLYNADVAPSEPAP